MPQNSPARNRFPWRQINRNKNLKYLVEITVGMLAVAAVLLLMGVSRLLVSKVDAPDLTVREIDLAADPAPPPPPPPVDDEPPVPAPPPLSLADIEPLSDLGLAVAVKPELPMDVSLPVDVFSLDANPAPLPVAQTARVSAPSQPERLAPELPPAKSVYSVGELDGKPRLLAHPSVSFPAALARRGVRRGTVVLEVELDEHGAVGVRRVISATHPELVAKARQIAAGSKFTPPLHRGRPVRAVMRWPIVIRR